MKNKIPPHKKYFILNSLENLENYYSKSKQREKNPAEKDRIPAFIHFLKGLLTIDPEKRWTASQARLHPFITGEPFETDWVPPSPQEGKKKDFS
jgi:dual specificity protein kinase YAK1